MFHKNKKQETTEIGPWLSRFLRRVGVRRSAIVGDQQEHITPGRAIYELVYTAITRSYKTIEKYPRLYRLAGIDWRPPRRNGRRSPTPLHPLHISQTTVPPPGAKTPPPDMKLRPRDHHPPPLAMALPVQSKVGWKPTPLITMLTAPSHAHLTASSIKTPYWGNHSILTKSDPAVKINLGKNE
ncbi:hypothetical protein AAG570_001806 [Ranatra chinensis]|uniref:Uncharacterized protein n=1 Tax=Ranatra chinensis TaxID=642074 RepID=A0ABD0Y9K9_9HEMI